MNANTSFFRGALRPQKPYYGLLGTGNAKIHLTQIYMIEFLALISFFTDE